MPSLVLIDQHSGRHGSTVNGTAIEGYFLNFVKYFGIDSSAVDVDIQVIDGKFCLMFNQLAKWNESRDLIWVLVTDSKQKWRKFLKAFSVFSISMDLKASKSFLKYTKRLGSLSLSLKWQPLVHSRTTITLGIKC